MLTRFDPFREMDRFAEHLLGSARNAASMPMDLYRADDHYVMHVDLPGIDPGSIDVSVQNNTLTIRAERTGRPEENIQWLARERAVGTYVRQLTLGDGLSRDQIDATYADGVLTLTIAIAEEAKPRRIEVNRVGNDQAIESSATERQEIQA